MDNERSQYILNQLRLGQTLTEAEAFAFFQACLKGQADPVVVASALSFLAVRGEQVDEIVGAARAMRAVMIPLPVPYETIDVCGTGGDGQHTLNISTAVALVLASAGLKVAKHGNRAITSQSGAADVLTSLGVNIDCQLETLRRCLDEANICFLFAPHHHPLMKQVAPIRRHLGFRTLFNLLGPLCNPAGARRQLIGVYSPDVVPIVTEALNRLGSTEAMVVHGDGLDELAIHGDSNGAIFRAGRISEFRLSPTEVGITPLPRESLCGGNSIYNAGRLMALLEGHEDAYLDSVCLNAAAGLIVGGITQDWREGVAIVRDLLKSGVTRTVLQTLIAVSNEAS